MFGVFSFFRGVGNILSTPISTALRTNNASVIENTHTTVPGGAYEGQYESVILYAGTCFAAAAVVVVLGGLTTGTISRRRETST